MSPKINNIGLGAQGHVRKSRNHMNEAFEGPHSITKSKSYNFKLKQNNLMELLNISFQSIYHKSGPQIATYVKLAGCCDFSEFSIGIHH